MKYAVLYESESGNTERIADAIYRALGDGDKEIINLRQMETIPDAETYLIGFGVRNGTCGISIINALEEITHGQIALFATCGLPITETYRDRIKQNLQVWLPDDVPFLGMFLCQGEIPEREKAALLDKMPEHRSQLNEALSISDSHPNQADCENAAAFIKHLLEESG